MKRYFLAPDARMPGHGDSVGNWHAIHVGSHGEAGAGWNLVSLDDAHVMPPEGWQALPRLVDARTPLKATVDHQLLADLGLTGEETMVEAAIRLGEIHPLMAP